MGTGERAVAMGVLEGTFSLSSQDGAHWKRASRSHSKTAQCLNVEGTCCQRWTGAEAFPQNEAVFRCSSVQINEATPSSEHFFLPTNSSDGRPSNLCTVTLSLFRQRGGYKCKFVLAPLCRALQKLTLTSDTQWTSSLICVLHSRTTVFMCYMTSVFMMWYSFHILTAAILKRI